MNEVAGYVKGSLNSTDNTSRGLLTWAVAVTERASATARERGQSVCESLREQGHTVLYVEDGDPVGLNADVLLMLENLADFGMYRRALAARAKRPVTAVWMLETLPPETMSPAAEAAGLQATRWFYRLGLLHPKRRLSTLRKQLTLRNARQWLFKQLSAPGFQRAAALLRRDDPRMNDSRWPQIRGALMNWECLRRAREGGWLDHCVVSTRQRQRFLARGGWEASFVPVGSQESDGRLLGVQRDIDVTFLGYLRDDRRAPLLERLRRNLAETGIRLEIVTGSCFAEERTRLLNRTKVLLMLHQCPWSPAWLRFLMAARCGACVVSEPMADTEPFQAGVHYASGTIEELPGLIGRLLADQRERERLAGASLELCTTSLTLHHSVRQLARIVSQPLPK